MKGTGEGVQGGSREAGVGAGSGSASRIGEVPSSPVRASCRNPPSSSLSPVTLPLACPCPCLARQAPLHAFKEISPKNLQYDMEDARKFKVSGGVGRR